ncbi:MAG: hypothetical protein NTZ18_01075 [Candidatus Komeilibacteria bacterium]|nr:hypothetical protein [Candidatus Komeilibacteria bacterium]
MTNFQGAPLEDQIKKLLEQNLAYSQQIYLITKKLKSYMFWGRIMGYVSIALVVLPIIISIIFLPTLLNGLMGTIAPGGLESSSGGVNSLLQGTNLNQSDLLNSIKNNGGIINSYKSILDSYKQ